MMVRFSAKAASASNSCSASAFSAWMKDSVILMTLVDDVFDCSIDGNIVVGGNDGVMFRDNR